MLKSPTKTPSLEEGRKPSSEEMSIEEKRRSLEETGKKIAEQAGKGVRFVELEEGWQPKYATVRYWFEGSEGNRILARDLDELKWKLSLGESPLVHHSMWLTPEQRKELETKYGAVAIRWAEEATKPGDLKAAEVAAEYYYNKIRSYFGLGHLSPKPTEEQIMKLRETLGLPVDIAEILRIHRETGYVQ